MRIKKIEWRNFSSYGNKTQKIEFEEESNLYQIVGENGSGKCLHPATKLKIRTENTEKILKFINK
jgi:predicted ATP-binding protein involved in virulence